MTTTNGWPGKPGVPMNAERDGWHWLKTGHGLAPWYWVEDQGAQGCFGWETDDDISLPDMLARYGTTYLGPVLTPDEVAKREDAKWHEGYAVGVLDVRRGTAFGEPDPHYATLQKRVAELEAALREMVYETTHLSPQNIDGSHWCKISKDALEKARAALTGGKDE